MALLFGGLAVAAGVIGRTLIDSGVAAVPSGTPGKLLWIVAPALLALGFRRLDPATRGRHLFALSRKPLVAAAIVAALTAVAAGVAIALGLAAGALAFAPAGVPAATLATSAASIALFAFLEESAWRGYLLPGLLPRVRYAVAVGVSSLVWWAWHLPYLDQLSRVYTRESAISIAPRLLLGVMAMQVLYTEVFLRYRSVWPAFAMHASFNLVANLAILSGLKLTGHLPWLLSPSADSVLLIVLSGGIGLWLYRRRRAAGPVTEPDARPADDPAL